MIDQDLKPSKDFTLKVLPPHPGQIYVYLENVTILDKIMISGSWSPSALLILPIGFGNISREWDGTQSRTVAMVENLRVGI